MRNLNPPRSVADEVVNLPTNSVVVAHYEGNNVDVLIRTGPIGWLSTHRRGSSGGTGYMNERTAREWVRRHESNGHTLTLISRDDLTSV